MPFIGNQPALSYTSFAKQDFTTSATTSYTLDNPVANANELALFINFVRQEPGSYSASGTTLTLTEATSSSDDMYCVFLGKAVQTVNPPNASVGTSQLVDGSVTSSKLSAGKVLQVVQTVKTDTQSTTGQTYVDGMTLNITPSSTSSKILIFASANIGISDSGLRAHTRLMRDSTAIFIGDSSGSRSRDSWQGGIFAVASTESINHTFLDSPNTTSQVTYKFQFKSETTNTAYIIYLNRNHTDSDSLGYGRSASSITAMEISG